jgi:nucleoside-diphosphate-sugar epimerase
VLVTGGSGFIGSNLVAGLQASGHEVLNLDIVAPRNPALASSWQRVDLRDARALHEAIARFEPSVVHHLGARTDLDGATVGDYEANTAGVRNLVASLADVPSVERVLFASSRLVCRIGYAPTSDTDYCPTTPYGASKVEGERIVRAACADARYTWAIVRPTSIWGPWFDVPYRIFFDAVARGRYVHPRGLAVPKSFGFVGNSVHALRTLAQAEPERIAGRMFYLADYPAIEVGEMASCIAAEAAAAPVRQVPMALLQGLATIGDAAKALGWREPPLTRFRLANLITPMLHDLEPLRAVVGDLPYTMPDGVRATVGWMREHRGLRGGDAG